MSKPPIFSTPIDQKSIVYLTTKFPLLSETFIYEELLALQAIGLNPRLLVFYHTNQSVAHQYISDLDNIVTCAPKIISMEHLVAQFRMFRRRPRRYLQVLWKIISSEWQRPMLAGKNLYAFCKAITLAYILENDNNAPQHIHAHWATMPTTAAMVISQLLDIPFSFTAHAWDIFKEQSMLSAKLRTADFVVTISEYNRQYLRRICSIAAEKIHVIRCGVNLTSFPYYQRHLSVDLSHILTVGRLVEKKGLHKLVEACSHLRDQGFDFICTIVGDGPQRATLERLIVDHSLEDMVRLTGGLPREELYDLWKTANVFVLPSVITRNGNRDGIPVVLMEAMALGIPVVSTTVSGIPELVEDDVTGILVPPNDANKLSQAIARLLVDPELATRLAQVGRNRVEREYDVARNTMAKAHLFSTALSKSVVETV